MCVCVYIYIYITCAGKRNTIDTQSPTCFDTS